MTQKSSKINTSKGKVYLTVVALASLLVMSFNLNTNMNSNMNAYASIFSELQNVDDVGQSLECVIVVVGCDGQGSVGSSGDVIIGSGDNDTSNGGGGGDDPLTCEECFEEYLTPAQIQIIIDATQGLTLAEICVILEANPGAIAEIEAFLLNVVGVDATVVADLVACLEAAIA